MIREKTIKAVELRVGARGLAADLAETSQDWEVDWLRIAYYLTHEAYNSGRAQSILKEYGADAEVYFDVYVGACNRCKELYLVDPEDPDSEPIVFKLKDIIANGNNIGRKVKEWKPTISPTHPYCRCTINHKKSGFAWDAELRAFVKPIKKVSKNPKLKGVKLNIKITKSENDLLEKAHNHGDVHSNGKWYWESSANGGKGDWRTIKKNKSTLKDNDWKTLKSVKDCEDFIDKNINFINNVDLSSCTIEQANLIAKTLKEFSDKNILKEKYKFSLQTFKGDSLKGGSYTMMKHSWNQGVLTIKSDLDVQHKRFKDKERRRYLKTFKTQLNNLDDRVEYLESEIEINEKYLERNPNNENVKNWVEKNNESLNNEKERLLYIRPDLVKKIENPDSYIWNPKNKTSISNLVRGDLKGSLIHELGHVLNSDLQTNWNNYSKEVQDELIRLKKKYNYFKDKKLLYQVGYDNLFEKLSTNDWNKISDYANYNGLEFFAEAFTKFYFKGETGIEEMDNLFKKIMK